MGKPWWGGNVPRSRHGHPLLKLSNCFLLYLEWDLFWPLIATAFTMAPRDHDLWHGYPCVTPSCLVAVFLPVWFCNTMAYHIYNPIGIASNFLFLSSPVPLTDVPLMTLSISQFLPYSWIINQPELFWGATYRGSRGRELSLLGRQSSTKPTSH